MGGHRNRGRRVMRRMERDTFRAVIMPAAWLCGFTGALVLLAAFLHELSAGSAAYEATGVGLGLLALPAVLLLYRILRGHFSAALDEP